MIRELWVKAVAFHGHECPGLAIGTRACEVAMERLGLNASADEELVCVTENDACGVDAVQALLGCTFGKGNLIFRNTGKQAFSFFERESGKRLRVVLKPMTGEMDRAARQARILEAPADEIFSTGEPAFDPPEPARIFTSVVCERCGESAAECMIRLRDGKRVCLDCHAEYGRGW